MQSQLSCQVIDTVIQRLNIANMCFISGTGLESQLQVSLYLRGISSWRASSRNVHSRSFFAQLAHAGRHESHCFILYCKRQSCAMIVYCLKQLNTSYLDTPGPAPCAGLKHRNLVAAPSFAMWNISWSSNKCKPRPRP